MAKKKKTKASKPAQAKLPDNMLPQNILAVGERVEEDKKIYISQSVYKQIQKFTKDKTTNESGGMLVGSVTQEFGKTHIVISGFVEAKHSQGTPTTLTFTHETWAYVHKEIEKKHPGKKILGWIHTHPNFGIFLSEYDKFIQQNFFSEEYQIAYVVDPIQNEEGFYFWIHGNIERCKGFYIYDKTGVKITVGPDRQEPEKAKPVSGFRLQNVLIALLSVAVVLLIFAQLSANSKIQELKEQQEAYAQITDQKINSLYQEIVYLNQLLGPEQADTDANQSGTAESES